MAGSLAACGGDVARAPATDEAAGRTADLLVDAGGAAPIATVSPSVDPERVRDGVCNCDSVELYTRVGGSSYAVPKQPIACLCNNLDCPTRLEDVERDAVCDDDRDGFVRVSGCGLVSVFSDAPSLVSLQYTFDEATGGLRGARQGSDTSFGMCEDQGIGAVSSYIYGEVLLPPEWGERGAVTCPEATVCRVCGNQNDPPLPACP